MKNKHRVRSNYQSFVKSSFCKKATALHLTFAIVSTLGGHNKLHNDEICSAWGTKYISTAFRYTLTRRSESQANSTMIRYKTGMHVTIGGVFNRARRGAATWQSCIAVQQTHQRSDGRYGVDDVLCWKLAVLHSAALRRLRITVLL